MYALPHFRKNPAEVAQQLREQVPQDKLPEVIGHLCVDYIMDAQRMPVKFLDQQLKEVEARKVLIQSLFKDELTKFEVQNRENLYGK